MRDVLGLRAQRNSETDDQATDNFGFSLNTHSLIHSSWKEWGIMATRYCLDRPILALDKTKNHRHCNFCYGYSNLSRTAVGRL